MNLITKENLHLFAYTNEEHLTSHPVGICIELYGLNSVGPFVDSNERARQFAEHGIIIIKPMTNPWSWLNKKALHQIECIIDIMNEKYPGIDRNICVSGFSMGGYEALMFSVYSKRPLLSCTVVCPLVDTMIFNDDDPMQAKTLIDAHYGEGDWDTILHTCNPIENIDRMQKIKYTVFQTSGDKIVNIARQAERFVKAANGILDIDYYVVAADGHCELTPDMIVRYNDCLLNSFPEQTKPNESGL